MPVLVFYLVGLYLAASVFSLVLAVSIRLRASRSAASHVGSLYFSFVLISLLLRLLEWHAPSDLSIWLVRTGLVASCIALMLLAQGIAIALTGFGFPLLAQMLVGAATLALIVVSFPFLPQLTGTGPYGSLKLGQRLFLLMPLLLFLAGLVLVAWLLRQRRLNLSRLSFDRVMAILPDQLFVFNRDGLLVDHNSRDPLLAGCRSREALAARFASPRGLLQALRQPEQRASGELAWEQNDPPRLWSWRVQTLKNQRGQVIGSLLLLSDITDARRTAAELEQQNLELGRVNRALADYSDLIERYAGAATEQEIAGLIDSSIRQRLVQAREDLDQALATSGEGQMQLAGRVSAACRQALADIRALVARLTC